MKALPNYSEINRQLAKTSLKLPAAQVHGILSGILCGNPTPDQNWEQLVTGSKEPLKTHEVLTALYNITAQQLNDFLFEYQLLLPADNQALSKRAEALTLWCQGFLTGLKLANIPIVERDPSETTEAINDIIEIAKLDYEDVASNEEDESAYMELVEYVRMAVVMIYQELQEKGKGKKSLSTNESLH